MATGRDIDMFNDEALYDFEDPNSRRRRKYEASQRDPGWPRGQESETDTEARGDHPEP